jgi:hypothetical protein
MDLIQVTQDKKHDRIYKYNNEPPNYIQDGEFPD